MHHRKNISIQLSNTFEAQNHKRESHPVIKAIWSGYLGGTTDQLLSQWLTHLKILHQSGTLKSTLMAYRQSSPAFVFRSMFAGFWSLNLSYPVSLAFEFGFRKEFDAVLPKISDSPAIQNFFNAGMSGLLTGFCVTGPAEYLMTQSIFNKQTHTLPAIPRSRYWIPGCTMTATRESLYFSMGTCLPGALEKYIFKPEKPSLSTECVTTIAAAGITAAISQIPDTLKSNQQFFRVPMTTAWRIMGGFRGGFKGLLPRFATCCTGFAAIQVVQHFTQHNEA